VVGLRPGSSGGEFDSPATVPPPPTGTAVPPATGAMALKAGVAPGSAAGNASVTRLVPGISNGGAPQSSGEDEKDPRAMEAGPAYQSDVLRHRIAIQPTRVPRLLVPKEVSIRDTHGVRTAGLTWSAKCSTTIEGVTSRGGKYRPSQALARHPLWDLRSGKSGRLKRQDIETRFTCRRRRCLPPSSPFVLKGRKPSPGSNFPKRELTRAVTNQCR